MIGCSTPVKNQFGSFWCSKSGYSSAVEDCVGVPGRLQRAHLLFNVNVHSLQIFLLALLAVKLIYVKHRRLSAIRSRILQSTSPHDVSLNSRSSLLSLKATQLKAFRSKCTPSLAILVGCLGSPAWETDIESDFDSNLTKQRRTASFMYQLHRQSKQRSSKSYSVAYRSSRSSTSQAPPSHAQLSRSMSFFSFSSEQSTEDATRKPRTHHLPNTQVLAYPTKARSRKTATIAPQRYSPLIDSSVSRQLGDFCEKCDAGRSSLRARNLYASGRVTSSVDLGPSLRLVGASDVTAVPYSFLSAFPPSSSYVLSPLTGTRDSLQLSRRHSTKSTRKPVPPLPPLPSNLVGQRPSCVSPAELSASLPPPASIPQFLPLLEFSPPASMGSFSATKDQAPAHLSNNTPLSPSNSSKLKTSPLVSPNTTDSVAAVDSLPHVLHPADPLVFAVQKMKRKTKHKRSSTIRSRSGIISSASPLRIMVLPEDMSDRKLVGDTLTSDKENYVTAISARKAIDNDRIHCLMTDASNRLSPIPDPTSSPDAQLELRHISQPLDIASSARSVKSTKSLARSDIEGSLSELSSLQTPKSDRLDEVDISMLGLDRFHWSEESEEMLKSCSSHIKNDSVALISFWGEGQWMQENNQWWELYLSMSFRTDAMQLRRCNCMVDVG
ncbi:uncharacterized protein BJ212DRAFT_1297178 [Suillus subaureus]|uniref:Uncharacterized protein n=1 Tax=Suillus subaureus TaxID=48587 RepID=A0A9P7EHA7_9AGAM|nr:uncharacterized protein BJ212DRAFT_1297178 [Suillus subaureus]KAG1821883.1 hypothetical protein BJ212DRAFT_1297178 [Suillus subaureus]